MLKVELHAHTDDDPCDHIPHSTRDLIDRASALGYDALAVTLHDRYYDPADDRDYASGKGVLLIAGVERTSTRPARIASQMAFTSRGASTSE